MASQGAVPTSSSAAHEHPAVTPSQASNAQSRPTSTAFPSAPVDAPSRDDPAASGQPTAQAVGSHALPPPLPAPESGDGGASTTTVEVNGARVSLADQLGPVVVNEDGTMSRIANWAEMSEIEKRNTVRVLGKRNKLRLDVLRGESSAPTSTS
ncbi:hypothetical protein CONLIGDRAFT_682609 [Coniochaeta ligniaria NRRL 30616]|uniref:Uncharacterized protein n=1 Tax=Coniochaeta ligniaria NRRL 30616 TaxID=1408157 RepID=A0A1J7IJW4_9PEZI|nr:hypothetical protein CONLIGDRAFT_682609 [Coniochaeta ligniaria NRRL 30616]